MIHVIGAIYWLIHAVDPIIVVVVVIVVIIEIAAVIRLVVFAAFGMVAKPHWRLTATVRV